MSLSLWYNELYSAINHIYHFSRHSTYPTPHFIIPTLFIIDDNIIIIIITYNIIANNEINTCIYQRHHLYDPISWHHIMIVTIIQLFILIENWFFVTFFHVCVKRMNFQKTIYRWSKMFDIWAFKYTIDAAVNGAHKGDIFWVLARETKTEGLLRLFVFKGHNFYYRQGINHKYIRTSSEIWSILILTYNKTIPLY